MRRFQVDPFAAVLAGVAAALLWLGGLHPLAAAAAGAVVAAAYPAAARGYAWAAFQLAMPPAGSAEHRLVVRAIAARAALDRICRAAPAGPVAARCRQMSRQGRPAVDIIRRLGLHAATVNRLYAAIGVEGLEAQRGRALEALAQSSSEAVAAELRSSLRATESQLATATRMRSLAEQLTARIQALTVSLEALTAGVAEVLALSQGDPSSLPAARLDQLADEVEALRGGLEAAQDLHRQATVIQLMEVH